MLISIGPIVSTDGYIVIYFCSAISLRVIRLQRPQLSHMHPFQLLHMTASPHQLATDNDTFLRTPVTHIPLFFRFVNKGRNVNQPTINLLRLSYLGKYVLHNPTTVSRKSQFVGVARFFTNINGKVVEDVRCASLHLINTVFPFFILFTYCLMLKSL